MLYHYVFHKNEKCYLLYDFIRMKNVERKYVIFLNKWKTAIVNGVTAARTCKILIIFISFQIIIQKKVIEQYMELYLLNIFLYYKKSKQN